MSKRTCLAIVLAAGEGTRMRSARPKVLHQVAGRSLLAHVLGAVRAAGTEQAAVVIGPDSDAVAEEAKRALPEAQIFVQSERRGTAHAVLSARKAASTWPRSDRPATACSTFGRAERMRVPSPAASTIARQVRPLISIPFNSRGHSRMHR